MLDLNVELKLERIRCYDEGDGPGNAEPYLWTVFFKADGETLVVNTDGPAPPFLQGPPTVIGTPGNHGNLGTSSVDAGDTVAIPAIIGEWRTVLKPIPLTTQFGALREVGGMMGVIAVLMEEDGTPASAIQRGHEALDRNVRDRLASLLGTLGISKQEPTEADVAALSDAIGGAVKDAIADGVSVLDWIGAFGNMDDQIGSAVFRFSHGQLESMGGAPIPFARRWRNEGDWEIFGSVKATAIPRRDEACCAGLRDLLAEQGRRLEELERRLAKAEADKALAKMLTRPRKRANRVSEPIVK
ncbi:hypothetical protein [Sediminicurvatus halobius]|uniref:Uncharacterized protein n=1 Tax=Sediminicurvatus halobius TaxID=2182432 RepID=A0A2U2MWQ4_9GAMM|nr:hypothetical protein [Spiribacter halobius]PWG61236.1 hypothetical protein DEM34_17575 [Spiribacter halobius]UEX79207.1 hypothetical protein LMH63_06100 [Spiribacter halobius]